MRAIRLKAVAVATAAAMVMQGCTSFDFSTFGDKLSGLRTPQDVEYYPDDEVLGAAKNQFHEGNYGRAQQYYQQAVAVAPNNAEAWLGLAASFDRIRRSDEADEAYLDDNR